MIGMYIEDAGYSLTYFRLATIVFAAIFFIRWMRRAYYNLHQTGIHNLKFSEGWAAGSWFIPIFNLFGPIIIIRQIFNETQNVYRLRDQPYKRQSDSITIFWWALGIISVFFVNISNNSFRSGDTTTGYLTAILSSLCYIADGIIAIILIKRISHHEDEMMLRAQQYYTWMQMNYAQQMNQPAPPENTVSEIPQRSTDIDRFMPPTQ